ncbi:hypothetical protein [Candidatus Synchoanobacter obligatus]|uniref:Uncharacterized protein n=1 Tax=Candidatus Synchoanobacter obligatus TaxID=2919597 RepID=A0ABT1L5D2_9GAMM|nr:hypothetical protein [Candidatus Synchoanobacter obligatus]MCP8352126.1 hypothetical protein [Candidatus Synchoanobacter obligatus]
MQTIPFRYFVLNPHHYLMILLLPWKLWPLCLALKLYHPSAVALYQKQNILFYISNDGEMIRIGPIVSQTKLAAFQIITCKLSRFVVVLK